MLYVSFWAIVLSNLPGGSFTKRTLSDGESAELVSTARKQEKLAGVSASDLFAPYAKRNYDLHMEICQALGRRGIEFSMKDFSSGDYCTPITLARVGRGSSMMVVDCNYELNSEAQSRAPATTQRGIERPPDLLRLATDTLRCYLFEATPQ
jgi:hypothetical protein